MNESSNNSFLWDGKNDPIGANILSTFDGGSMGQQAIKELGIPVRNYFASEIDKKAIEVAMYNHLNTKQIGDVTKVKADDLPKIDLLMGGSPCQGFSSSGKGLNFEDPRSKLFFEFVRLKNELNPKYWLLENVKPKKQEWADMISELLGVDYVVVNSIKTSAQNRVRYIWANFEITEPKDQGIKLEDILEDTEMLGPSAIRGRRLNKATILGRRLDKRGKRQDYDKSIPITQCLEVRASNRDKSNCLTTVAKDTVLTTMPVGRHPGAFEMKDKWRNYTKIERCRLMNLPDTYFDCTSLNQAVKISGNGWDVGMFKHIFNCLIRQVREEKTVIAEQ